MIDAGTFVSRPGKALTALLGVAVVSVIIWVVSTSIVAANFKVVFVLAAAMVICAVAGKTLNNWRTGIYLFLVWLLFEDLVRKYMGNNMVIYFGKDALVGVTYIAFVLARLRGEVRGSFRPPFKYALGFFVMLGVAQVFNSGSPSLWYGLLGLKLYFYYIPLMFVGYALLRTEHDLQSFLFLNAGLDCDDLNGWDSSGHFRTRLPQSSRWTRNRRAGPPGANESLRTARAAAPLRVRE